jgi:predicted alpha/beta hydrolase family esterase
MTVLLLHGFEGNGPGHWQTLLAEALAGDGIEVRYPALPAPFAPDIEAWLDALAGTLTGTDAAALTVLGHSCGAALWLHHLARGGRSAWRTVLVAPPGPRWSAPTVRGFMPIPLPTAPTAIVIAGDDDPYCTAAESGAYANAIGAPLVLIPGGGHLHTAAGYGRWPALEAWCRGQEPTIDLAAALAQSSTGDG